MDKRIAPPWEGKEQWYSKDGVDVNSMRWAQREFDIVVKQLLTGKEIKTFCPSDFSENLAFDGDLYKEEVTIEVPDPSDMMGIKTMKITRSLAMTYGTKDLSDFWIDKSTLEPEEPLMGFSRNQEEPIPPEETYARKLYNFVWLYKHNVPIPEDLYEYVVERIPFEKEEQKDEFLGVERFKTSHLWDVLRENGIHFKILFAMKQAFDDIIRQARLEGVYDIKNPLKEDIIMPIDEYQTAACKAQRVEYIVNERFLSRRVSVSSSVNRKSRKQENGNWALIIKDIKAEQDAKKLLDELVDRIKNPVSEENSDRAALKLCSLWVSKTQAGKPHIHRLLMPLLACALNKEGTKLYNLAREHEKNRVICLAFGDPESYVQESWQRFFIEAVKNAKSTLFQKTQGLQASSVWLPTKKKDGKLVVDLMADLFRQSLQARIKTS